MVANTIFCVRIVCLIFCSAGFHIPLAGGRLGGEKNMWALIYLFIGAAFSMGWDYAERMLYLSTWMFFMDKGILVSVVFLFPLSTRSQTRDTIIVITQKATYTLAGKKAALSSPLATAGLFAQEGRTKP